MLCDDLNGKEIKKGRGIHVYIQLVHSAVPEKLTRYCKATISNKGFPGGSAAKESACNAGDLDSTPGLGRSPGGGHGNALQYSCLENPHGQRSLVGYSPWGRKELDIAE